MNNSPVTLSHWHTEPTLIGGILFVAWLYAIIIGPCRTSICPTLCLPAKRIVFFALGILTFYLAVGSPLDPLGENFLFSAHMIQHNVLMYVSPLLVLLGLPPELIDRFLEKKTRSRMDTQISGTSDYCGPSFYGRFLLLAHRRILRGRSS